MLGRRDDIDELLDESALASEVVAGEVGGEIGFRVAEKRCLPVWVELVRFHCCERVLFVRVLLSELSGPTSAQKLVEEGGERAGSPTTCWTGAC
jgi:hypothetical protein